MFPLQKANKKRLGEGWYPDFSSTAVLTAFCSHSSFAPRSGGKRQMRRDKYLGLVCPDAMPKRD